MGPEIGVEIGVAIGVEIGADGMRGRWANSDVGDRCCFAMMDHLMPTLSTQRSGTTR